MKIKDLLTKLGKGETLTDEEKNFLADWKEPEANTSEADTLRAKLATITAELKTMKERAENAETKGLSDIERVTRERDTLATQVASLTTERDNLNSTLGKERFTSAVSALAAKYKCDPEYLAFKLNGTDKDLRDEAVSGPIMEQLKKSAPRFFDADVHPGGADPALPNASAAPAASRLNDLLRKADLTPAEQLECMKLAREDRESKDNSESNK